jgi:hypothetical protein
MAKLTLSFLITVEKELEEAVNPLTFTSPGTIIPD